MKIYIVICLVSVSLLVAANNNGNAKNVDNEWVNFKKEHKKAYADATEEGKRKEHFKKNFNKIDACNQNSETSTCGINKHSDWSDEELLARNGRLPVTVSNRIPKFNPKLTTRATVPKVDLRTDVCMAPIKDQGNCGSCWAHAACAGLEFNYCRAKGNVSVVLSEQNLIDCSASYGTSGCNGGLEYNAWNYVKANGGQNSLATYPYKAVQGTCAYKSSSVAAKVNSESQLLTVTDIMNALATGGTVTAGVDASLSSFQFYKSGIYADPACTANMDHSVAIVGYDTINGTDVWIMRNSWSTSWGINGYMYIKRGVNQCGIESDVHRVVPL